MKPRFSGAVVLVTGAARGLGKLAAERYAAEGARLVLGDIDRAALGRVALALHEGGSEVAFLAGDVAQEASAEALVNIALSRFGRLDVAVNNAGVAHDLTRLSATDPVVMERMFAINVMGVFHFMKREIAVMEKQGSGAILNVASVAGVTGAPLLGAYAASKHAVVGLTRSGAAETAGKGVRINALCPAFTATDMVDAIAAGIGGPGEEAKAKLAARIPMRRIGRPEEIVEAMLFATDPANSFMTGQTIVIDGGLTSV